MSNITTITTKIARFITSTSLVVALDGPLIVLFGYFLYGSQINFVLLVAAFLSVFAIYNLNKVTDITEDTVNKPEVTDKSKSKYYVVASVVALTLGITLGASVSFLVLTILLSPLIIGILYSIKIPHILPKLKEITGVKNLLVAFSWSISGVFLPLFSHLSNIENILVVFAYLFIMVFVNTVVFDSLDVKGDVVAGIKTIPVALGNRKTKLLLLSLNNTLCVGLIICGFNGLFLNFMPTLLFGVLYGNFIILYFLKHRSRRLRAELIVDGQWIPILAFMVINLAILNFI